MISSEFIESPAGGPTFLQIKNKSAIAKKKSIFFYVGLFLFCQSKIPYGLNRFRIVRKMDPEMDPFGIFFYK